jgi:hypothetical protein
MLHGNDADARKKYLGATSVRILNSPLAALVGTASHCDVTNLVTKQKGPQNEGLRTS